MAKSRASTKASTVEKRSTNKLVEQFYNLRSEVRKVTWPTRQEAWQLTRAVTIATVIIAIFLYAVDALFSVIVTRTISLNVVAIVGGLVAIALVGLAFYANSREV